MDGACCPAGMVEREESLQDGEGTRAEVGVGEDLAEVGWSVGFLFRKLWLVGSEKRM